MKSLILSLVVVALGTTLTAQPTTIELTTKYVLAMQQSHIEIEQGYRQCASSLRKGNLEKANEALKTAIVHARLTSYYSLLLDQLITTKSLDYTESQLSALYATGRKIIQHVNNIESLSRVSALHINLSQFGQAAKVLDQQADEMKSIAGIEAWLVQKL